MQLQMRRHQHNASPYVKRESFACLAGAISQHDGVKPLHMHGNGRGPWQATAQQTIRARDPCNASDMVVNALFFLCGVDEMLT